jgi:hypothetical protein
MPTPSEIRDEALRALRLTQRQLNSPAWILALEEKDGEMRRRAAEQLLAVQRAKVQLENAELSDIRDALRENEAGLESGRASLERALKSLTKVRDVMTAVQGFLGKLEPVLGMLG